MKLIKNLFVAGIMVIISSCDPIEERDVLKNSFNPDNIELEVIQTAGGKGNGLTLKMNTPGVNGWWNFIIDKRNSDVVNVVFPFKGTHTFTYTVATPFINGGNPADREVIVKEIEVTIDELDQPLPQPYYNLIGEDLAGKTWVLDKQSLSWYMSPNPANGGDPFTVWWDAQNCCPPPDNGGKMVFDLDGGPNFTYYADANGPAGSTGTFRFNPTYDRLYIEGGTNILGVSSCAVPGDGTVGEFQIKQFTSNRLVLYIPTSSCGSGWTWIFVPAS